jgi:hypothetical protein
MPEVQFNFHWAATESQQFSKAIVAHACNPSYSGGRDQEDHSLKLVPRERVRETLSRTKVITKKGLAEWLKQ